MEENKTTDWAAQQSDAVHRMREGGGLPGLARAEQIAGKSGRQILEAMVSGELPYPPMNDTMNLALLEVGDGRAVFQGIPLLAHYNPLGSVHGGWFASLLDSALGCAIQSALPNSASRSCGLRPTKPARCGPRAGWFMAVTGSQPPRPALRMSTASCMPTPPRHAWSSTCRSAMRSAVCTRLLRPPSRSCPNCAMRQARFHVAAKRPPCYS
jgi:hypothetical protein